MKLLKSISLLLLLLISTAELVQAQVGATRGEFLVSADNHRFTSGIDSWKGVNLGLILYGKKGSYWNGELNILDRFGEPSFAYSAGYTKPIKRWIFRTGFRTSSDGFYNPLWRIDIQVGHKFRQDQRLVAFVSGYQREGRDGHKDTSLGSEIQFYATGEWVFQSGAQFLHSNPGDSWGYEFYAASTLGIAGRRQVTARVAFGQEAYSVLDPLIVFTEFKSRNASIQWREWISRDIGTVVDINYYENPFYSRLGFKAGLVVSI
jgi:YaiO family outer membrane protein